MTSHQARARVAAHAAIVLKAGLPAASVYPPGCSEADRCRLDDALSNLLEDLQQRSGIELHDAPDVRGVCELASRN